MKELCLFGDFHSRNSYALTARNERKSLEIGLNDDQAIKQPFVCYNNAMYKNPNELEKTKDLLRSDEGFV